jgi:hypothetical protein
MSSFLLSLRTAALALNICQLRENLPAMRIPFLSYCPGLSYLP